MIEVTLEVISPKLQGLWKPARLKLLDGGRGSGKSMAVAEYLIIKAMEEKCRILCAREIQKSIQESSKRLLEETAERLGVSQFFIFQKTSIQCTLSNSEFLFEGLHRNTTKIKGLQGVKFCWVEEAETISKESLQILFPTIRGDDSEIICTYNPRYSTDPIHILRSNPPSYAWVQSLNFDDNPHFPAVLDQERLECLRSDPDDYKWIWLGQCVSSSDRSFITSRHIDLARNRTPIFDKSSPIIGGLDVARFGGDRIALVVRQGAIILAVEIIEKADTIELSDWAVEMIIKHKIEFLSIDSAGSAGVYDLVKSMSDVEVYAYNGGHSAEQADKYRNCRAESWGRVKDWFKNEGAIDKSDYWDEATRVLFKYDEQNRVQLESKEIMRSRGVKSPDIIDALSMTFINIFGRSKTREKLKALRRSR